MPQIPGSERLGTWQYLSRLVLTDANLTAGVFDDVAGHALRAEPFVLRDFSKVRLIAEGVVILSAAGRAILALQSVSRTGAPMGNIGGSSAIVLDTGAAAIDAGAKTLAMQLTAGDNLVTDSTSTRDVASAYGAEKTVNRAVPHYATGYVYLDLGATGSIAGELTVELWGYR